MKISLKLFSLCLIAMLFAANPLLAQVPETTDIRTEASEIDRPVDDIVEKRMIDERRVLPYQPLREADIFWEKRIWRVIDIREKMNLPFAYPEMPFFTILMDAAINGDISVYSTEDDKFTSKIEPNEVASMGATVDTVITFDPETYEEQIQVVTDAFRALKDEIPGIIGFEHGVNNSPEGKNLDFTHVYLMTFENEEARDTYLPHPKHSAFGEILMGSGIFVDAFVVDYVPMD